MSIKYKVVRLAFGFDKTKKARYVVKQVTGEVVTFDKVRTQVVQICGVHRGIVNLVTDGLIDVMVNNLDMGHSVQLGDFGTFRPGIRAKAQDDEKKANADTVYRRKLNFVPGKMLKSFLKDVAITRMAIIDTDYTDGATTSEDGAGTSENTDVNNGDTNANDGNSGDNGDSFVDPNA